MTRRAARPSGFSISLHNKARALEWDVLSGLDSILRFAGAEAPPTELFTQLSSAHGQRIGRAVRRAARLAEALAERAPPGYEVFTVHAHDEGTSIAGDDINANKGLSESVGHHDGHDHDHAGAFLCGCMESVERDVRRWVSAGLKRRGGASTVRSARSTRAGTRRARSGSRAQSRNRTERSRSRAPTEHSRTDTNVRTWDRDSNEEEEEAEEEDDEEIEEDDDVYEEDILLSGPGHAGASVVCTLGFGLRRVLRVRREHKSKGEGAELDAAVHDGHSNMGGTYTNEPELQRERRRVDNTLLKEPTSKSSYSIITSTFSSSSASSIGASTHRTEKPRPSGATVTEAAPVAEHEDTHIHAGEKNAREHGRGRWVDGEKEIVVKASVLMSSTLEMLQRHLIR